MRSPIPDFLRVPAIGNHFRRTIRENAQFQPGEVTAQGAAKAKRVTQKPKLPSPNGAGHYFHNNAEAVDLIDNQARASNVT
ncbi:MAG: hypothetical protein JWM11_1248 [Planctomycetaceae bacterium]|nr:hypothetical protein [Planctomycetaceae bacterium]